jgi:hypothetical protein
MLTPLRLPFDRSRGWRMVSAPTPPVQPFAGLVLVVSVVARLEFNNSQQVVGRLSLLILREGSRRDAGQYLPVKLSRL